MPDKISLDELIAQLQLVKTFADGVINMNASLKTILSELQINVGGFIAEKAMKEIDA